MEFVSILDEYKGMITTNGMLIVERIDKLLKTRGEKRPQLCKALNIPINNLSNWSLRGNVPPADVLYNIAEYLNTSIEYLLTGKDKNNETLFIDEIQMGYIAVIAKYKMLSPKEKSVILDLLNVMTTPKLTAEDLQKALEEKQNKYKESSSFDLPDENKEQKEES